MKVARKRERGGHFWKRRRKILVKKRKQDSYIKDLPRA